MKFRSLKESENLFFMTSVIVEKVPVFSATEMKSIIVDSLRFCQLDKDLQIAAWVLMINHLHLVARRGEGPSLATIMKDFKSFTSRSISKSLRKSFPEDPVLKVLVNSGKRSNKHEGPRVWEAGLHAFELTQQKTTEQKINYIHQNPVKAGIVESPEQYRWSSAIDYAGGDGLLDITFPDFYFENSIQKR